MYADRMRDPTSPQSYDFRASDAMWRAIVEGGFEPYFRLGDSWNNARPPANAQERANWVRAAVEVVRHYREGQWDGFTTPFRYVEIWNEPDNQQFWPRPHDSQEYFQLYVETAQALKQAFSDACGAGYGQGTEVDGSQRVSESASQRVSESARQRDSEAARQRGSESARGRGGELAN